MGSLTGAIVVGTTLALTPMTTGAQNQITDPAVTNGSFGTCASSLCVSIQNKSQNTLSAVMGANEGNLNQDIRQQIESFQKRITGDQGTWIGGTWYITNTPKENLAPYIGLSPKADGGGEGRKADRFFGPNIRLGAGVHLKF